MDKYNKVKSQILSTLENFPNFSKSDKHKMTSQELADILNEWNSLNDVEKDMMLRMLYS